MLPKILLIDDNHFNVDLLEEILRVFDVEIIKGYTGKDAIKFTNEFEFAFVILDINMPVMDGYTALKEIRKNESNINLPVIISSGIYKEDKDIVNSIKLGAIDFMPKPINPDILVGKARIYLSLFQQKKDLNNAITQLQETITILSYEQDRLSKLSMLIPDGIILTDENENITYYNIAAQNIFDFNNNTGNGNTKLLQFLPELNTHKNILSINQSLSVETVGKRNNKKYFFAEISYTFLFFNNIKTNIYVIRDITKRKQTEKKLLKAKELKESNKVMKEFMANMSHELRTPMNAIIGISKMLIKYKSDNLSEKQLEGLKTISESGFRLLDLINDILDLSKLEANKAILKNEPFSIEKLISNLKSTVISLIGYKPINFLIHKSNNVPDTIIADKKKLMQILLNLLGNSIKFTEKGKIVLNIYSLKNELYFEVTDTGIGISKNNQKKIFQKFIQIDSSISRQYKGTGLGLAICESLTTLLGGKILVESELNKGTTIRFFIVFEESKSTDKTEEKYELIEIKNSVKKYNALIIEDDETSNYIFKNYLNDHNFNVEFANDGITGFNKILSLKHDLIILSLEIPKLSGYGVMKKLNKESEKIKDIPIILTSITDFIPDKTKYSYDIFLSKPINENTLILYLKKIIIDINK